MTNLEIIIETIETMIPTGTTSPSETKQIILDYLKKYGLEKEREQLISAFIEGQSKPHASFQAWADKKFNTLKTKTDDSE